MTLQTFATAQRFRVARALRGQRPSLREEYAQRQREHEARMQEIQKLSDRACGIERVNIDEIVAQYIKK